MTPLELLPNLKTGLDLARTLREALKKPETQPDEIAARLLEIIDHITDSKIAASELVDTLYQLKRERDQALQKLALVDDMEFVQDGQFYVRLSEKEKGLIPYCPVCWSEKQRPVHLIRVHPSGQFACGSHDRPIYFKTQAYVEMVRQKSSDAERLHSPSSGPWA